MRWCLARRRGRVRGENVDAGALAVSPGTRRVGDCGRRRAGVSDEGEQGVDALLRVDVVTAVDHVFGRRPRRDLISPAAGVTAAIDEARVSSAGVGCRRCFFFPTNYRRHDRCTWAGRTRAGGRTTDGGCTIRKRVKTILPYVYVGGGGLYRSPSRILLDICFTELYNYPSFH